MTPFKRFSGMTVDADQSRALNDPAEFVRDGGRLGLGQFQPADLRLLEGALVEDLQGLDGPL